MKQLVSLLLLITLLGCTKETEINNNPVYSIDIVSQPVDATVYSGQIASFGISVSGTDPQYKWYKDNVFYADGPQITILADANSNNATFYCDISNGKGSVSSHDAVLTVIDAPEPEYNNGMCKIPASTYSFVMGSVSPKALANESPLHTVTFSNSFWIDTVPISQSYYESIMKEYNPTTHDSLPWDSLGAPNDLLPASSISWNDAVMFCNARSCEESLDSMYSYEILVIVDNSDTNKTWLYLTDSLLIRWNDGVPDTSKCTIEDGIAIIQDTVKLGTIQNDTIDTTVFPVWEWTITSDSIPVVPNESYQLINARLSTSRDSVVNAVTKLGERDTIYSTVLETFSDTVYVRIIEDTAAEKRYDFSDTLYGENGEFFDTSIVFAEGQYDTIVGDTTLPLDLIGYRLPTEAEWEYAARGGSGADYFWGDETDIDDYAWCSENTDSLEQSGILDSNVYGVYDMSGNLWEWCHDYYAPYTREEQTDPMGPSSGDVRVKRGGAWSDSPIYLRSSQRGSGDPKREEDNTGFRTVLTDF